MTRLSVYFISIIRRWPWRLLPQVKQTAGGTTGFFNYTDGLEHGMQLKFSVQTQNSWATLSLLEDRVRLRQVSADAER